MLFLFAICIVKFVLTNVFLFGYTYCEVCPYKRVSVGYTYCEVCPYKRVSVGYTYCEVCPYKHVLCWLYVL